MNGQCLKFIRFFRVESTSILKNTLTLYQQSAFYSGKSNDEV
jgi:hypothetical protein